MPRFPYRNCWRPLAQEYMQFRGLLQICASLLVSYYHALHLPVALSCLASMHGMPGMSTSPLESWIPLVSSSLVRLAQPSPIPQGSVRLHPPSVALQALINFSSIQGAPRCASLPFSRWIPPMPPSSSTRGGCPQSPTGLTGHVCPHWPCRAWPSL